MLGVSDSKVNEHVGWNQHGMIKHYATMGELCGPRRAAAALSEAALNLGCENS